ncbi:MAG: CPBP family intramembrane glutamic endopeptidase [Cyclobacteriaceae bacterium]
MQIKIPLSRVLTILIGFPAISYLLSLLLLRREWFDSLGLDFFTLFWMLIGLWYLIQIGITIRVLKASHLDISAIGYRFNFQRTAWLITGYLIIAFALFGFIEFALASANVTEEEINSLSDLSNITPKTTTNRIIFIVVGLVAGISEEFVYRGFAIQSLEGYNINKWIAVIISAIPFVFQHGLKSIDQFWWFFIWGLVLGIIFILTKRKLYINIIIHWLIILSGMLAILQLID